MFESHSPTESKPKNAHQRPPESIQSFYKTCQKINLEDLSSNPRILDLDRDSGQTERLKIVDHICYKDINAACKIFGKCRDNQPANPKRNTPVYESMDVPGKSGMRIVLLSPYVAPDFSGLLLIPKLLPHQTQWALLSRLLHDCLANHLHRTNLHAHYEIPYGALLDGSGESFFSLPPESTTHFQRLEPASHGAVTVSQVLEKKLRWVTLGGQYDWTEKVYHQEDSPLFPQDIANLMQAFFPDTKAEVAITNIYSPGDKLSLHRDVSEDSPNGLISISLGCDCIFVIGLADASETGRQALAIRLRSGDVLYMSGSSRFAWHGVPQVIKGTCPSWLAQWPATQSHASTENYQAWRGWMSNKRINLNIRQLNT